MSRPHIALAVYGLVLLAIAGCGRTSGDSRIAEAIGGTWVSSEKQYTSEVLVFDSNGNVQIGQTSTNTLSRTVANLMGTLHGQFSVSNQQLVIRVTGADNTYVDAARRGEIIRADVLDFSDSTLVLSRGILGGRSGPIEYKRVP